MVAYPLPEYKKESSVINYDFRSVPELGKVVYEFDLGHVGTYSDFAKFDGGEISGSGTLPGVRRFSPLPGNRANVLGQDISGSIAVVWEITVTNTSDHAEDVVLFDAARNMLSVNFGLSANIMITGGDNLTYQEMIVRSMSMQSAISMMRYTSSTGNVNRVMSIQQRDGNGQTMTIPLQIAMHYSAFQFQSNVVDVNMGSTGLNHSTSLRFSIDPKETIGITLHMGSAENRTIN